MKYKKKETFIRGLSLKIKFSMYYRTKNSISVSIMRSSSVSSPCEKDTMKNYCGGEAGSVNTIIDKTKFRT